MATVSEIFDNPARREALIEDAARFLDAEVAARGGVSGLAVKAAFGMVKALKPGIIRDVLASLLPDFARSLEPIIQQRPQGEPLARYFESRRDDVVRALLSVTDERARRTDNRTLVGAYNKLRPTAEKQVGMSVPGLGRMLEKHLDTTAAA